MKVFIQCVVNVDDTSQLTFPICMKQNLLLPLLILYYPSHDVGESILGIPCLKICVQIAGIPV